jgi:hypothetical protein
MIASPARERAPADLAAAVSLPARLPPRVMPLILVVEDNEDLAFGLSRSLEAEGTRWRSRPMACAAPGSPSSGAPRS